MKERNHKCDFCGRLFARKDTLRRHMEDGCSKRFDVGTCDLGADVHDPTTRAIRGPMDHLKRPPHSNLPPISMSLSDGGPGSGGSGSVLLHPVNSVGRSMTLASAATEGAQGDGWPR
ncbi:hypothetical protein Cob_v004097 [Colletotrichum orbiculare MAFF 240422]|uniref:C2H2-type domain-containing protein n=1 Tax=Colletotrichum orbiculare (strain 104-T / ATCC 96160 / CBS 514.97 / LARS 414 / MAFF 240422) TaxID=1213857 RepID=A0A484FYK4_COLOR|nr:hypothetical protein Cob_v004097 [Colletotrichum orbiculare MAFF 240422]